MKNPCYQCTKRTSTCHSTCKDYKDFVTENEEKKAFIRKKKAEEDAYRACRVSSKWKEEKK